MVASAVAEACVEAHDLSKTYRIGLTTVAALVSASCRVEPGDRIAVVGPSGSGKSTLLQLLGGLEEPTAGRICWPCFGAREALRPSNVAFIFQNRTLVPALSAVENVELPLLLREVGPQAARRIALETLQRFDLLELAAKLPESLSGGQAQRVAAARAVAGAPALILADEPTGQLDRAGADRLLDLLLGQLRPDAALVVATHDARVAARMETAWYMLHGVLMAR